MKETEEDAYIVVPKNVEFQDVKAEIVPEDKSGKSKKGTLTYTYDWPDGRSLRSCFERFIFSDKHSRNEDRKK